MTGESAIDFAFHTRYVPSKRTRLTHPAWMPDVGGRRTGGAAVFWGGEDNGARMAQTPRTHRDWYGDFHQSHRLSQRRQEDGHGTAGLQVGHRGRTTLTNNARCRPWGDAPPWFDRSNITSRGVTIEYVATSRDRRIRLRGPVVPYHGLQHAAELPILPWVVWSEPEQPRDNGWRDPAGDYRPRSTDPWRSADRPDLVGSPDRRFV